MAGAVASPYVSAPAPRRALAPAVAVSLGVHAVALAAALWWRFDGGAAEPAGFVVEVAFLETSPAAESPAPPAGSPSAAAAHVEVPPPAVAVEPLPVDSRTAAEIPVNEAGLESDAVPPPEPVRDAITLALPAPPRPRPPLPSKTPPAAAEPAPSPARPPSVPAQLASAAPLSDMAAPAGEAADVARAPVLSSAAAAAASTSAPASILPAVVTNPRFRRTPVPPTYPRRALDLGQEGEVVVRALVGTDGESRDIRLWRSSGVAVLDEAALRAVRRWAFEAARVDGQPIEAWVEVPVRFHLRTVL